MKAIKYEVPANPHKSAEQILQEFKEAQHQFIDKLAVLLYWGNYPLSRVMRDWSNKKVLSAEISLDDGIRMFLRSNTDCEDNSMEISVYFPENPVNDDLLKAYDKIEIENKISYHKLELKLLEEHKKELGL